MPSDHCTQLGIPDHLHTCGRVEDQDFVPEEKLYRRHRLGERKIKTVITFRQMSVNREKYCLEVSDILINSQTGARYEGYGVVSFSVEAVQNLRHEIPSTGDATAVSVTVTVRHDVAEEPCNFSHTLVNGCENGKELTPGRDLGSIARKLLRHQIWQAVTTEIPADQAGDNLEGGSSP